MTGSLSADEGNAGNEQLSCSSWRARSNEKDSERFETEIAMNFWTVLGGAGLCMRIYAHAPS